MQHRTTSRGPLQFRLRTLFVFMAGLGLACALAPQGFWPLQVYGIAYLLIGFGQVCYSLSSWWRLRRKSALGRTPSQDATPFLQLGCWLTLPTWLLVLAWLAGGPWYRAPARDELLWAIFAVWSFLAFMGQIAALLVNLVNLADAFRPIDGALRRLALLNMAHTGILLVGLVASWFLPPIH